jgi:hypothetical protein
MAKGKCNQCKGTGRCQQCKGVGKSGYPGWGDKSQYTEVCSVCQGSGVCPWCRGEGESGVIRHPNVLPEDNP